MREVVIAGAVRTAIGAFGGALASVRATDLGAIVISEAINRAGLNKAAVDEVIMGNVLPAGLGQNPARQAMLKAGLPHGVGAVTVNKVCGSGLKAVMLAAQAIACGDADVVIAGGLENMNLAPYYLMNARTGYRMGQAQAVDGMVHDGLWDHVNDFHMGMSAELCAEKYGVTRQDQDEYAYQSYQRAVKAQLDGLFAPEIVPVPLPQKKGDPLLFKNDEIIRETGPAALAKLAPAFKKDGTVTAGNSSKIADGAAALILASADYAGEHHLPVLARIGAQASDGLDPKYVLVAPILAVPKVLRKAGLTLADIDLFEINEAFSSSTVAVMRELGLDPAKVNVQGGSVAMGHPIGASGARVLVTLLHTMARMKAKRGLATLCLGGGEAVALIVEKLPATI
ncbi:MAG: acetyl-CoA C-acetyltransferase [Deltaproteobacteria bacterium]|nr:acetyl-CoA C-acetyltransferase [Deltaproteobacteria bacterium]